MCKLNGALHGLDKSLIKTCWSPDSSRIASGSGSNDRTVNIWKLYHKSKGVMDSEVEYKLPGHLGAVNQVDWHPEEPVVVSCSSDHKVILGELQ